MTCRGAIYRARAFGRNELRPYNLTFHSWAFHCCEPSRPRVPTFTSRLEIIVGSTAR